MVVQFFTSFDRYWIFPTSLKHEEFNMTNIFEVNDFFEMPTLQVTFFGKNTLLHTLFEYI